MINLIRIETKKIFHKKSFFIIYLLMISFCLLNNILYWKDYDQEGNYKYQDKENLQQEKKTITKELEKYDSSKESDISLWISLKTKLDILELKEQFSVNSWQYQKLNDYLYDTIYQMNQCKYREITNLNCDKYTETYTLYLEKLKQENWSYFIQEEITKVEATIKKLKTSLSETNDKATQLELQKEISTHQENLKILNYRLQNQIKEDNSYFNQSFIKLVEGTKKVKDYQQISQTRTLTYEEQQAFYQSLFDVAISKYEIEKQEKINKPNTLNYNLRTIVEDYELFLVIIILMVATTSICEEFSTGTVKLLLIKPYSRVKILLSKYFASIGILLLSIFILIIVQFLAGGIFLGFNSLSTPVVTYHYQTSTVTNYSVWIYMLIRVMTKLPLFIMLLTMSFAIGIILTNSVATITIPLTIYMFSPYIKQLAVQYQLKFMRYFIGLNWNFEDYLFGALSDFQYVDVKFSLIIYLIYLVGGLGITICIFQKKNIKNI